MDTIARDRRPASVGFFHCTLTGAAVLGVLFALCWATEAGGRVPVSRAFIRLFTERPDSPPQSLIVGLFWSLLAGALVGGLIALCFNLIGALPRVSRHR